MAPPRRHDLDRDDGSDSADLPPLGADAVVGETMEDNGESSSASSSSAAGAADSASSAFSHAGRRAGARGGLAESLADVLSGDLDGDTAIDGEHWVLRWVRALDLQVLGACRADERLKPLFKFNASSGAAEDRFLAQISQHFEVSEVGMLTRYLCVPLVSLRVGKIDKQGDRLCPTAARGHLNLNMLPSSSMRLSYVGDDGSTERLALVNDDFDAIIEDISADPSGRSFVLKLPGSRAIYYWCSEKSKFHGKELIAEMKDLLRRKPSLSILTGISQSRLDSFATHLRTYLIECFSRAEINSTAVRNDLVCHLTSQGIDSQSSCVVSNFPRSNLMAAHSGKVHSSCQGNLSPRLSSFKDGNPKTSSYARSGNREKLKRHVDSHLSSLTTNNEQTSMPTAHIRAMCTSQFEDDDLRGAKHAAVLPCCLPDIPSLPPSPLISLNPSSIHSSSPMIIPSSKFSPYYCWCPPCPSSLQYPVPSLQQQSLPSESLPLSPLLLAAVPTVSAMPSKQPIDVGELRGLTFPAVVPNPLFPVPFSVSSRTLSVSQQISSFPPFMSDPIVHIPVIDVCSSGQGYLVSAGPAISSAISPLLPSIVNPLIPKTESMAEKSARETLKMLLSSPPIASTGPQLMNVVPVVLNSVDKKLSCANVYEHGDLAFSNCALFEPETPDVDAVVREPFLGLYPSEELTLSREVKRSSKAKDGGDYDEVSEGP